MISLCVFSRNRPMQLDAFLNSLEENAPYITDVWVLYKVSATDQTTMKEFDDGYYKVKKRHQHVKFVEESVFDRDIFYLMNNFQEYFAWATDDSIFYRPVNLSHDKMHWAFKGRGVLALNLRMGLNIAWQNHWHSERSAVINVKDGYEDVIIYDAKEYSVNTDVGRVWQNDASIMPTALYLDQLNKETMWQQSVGCRGLDNVGQSGTIFDPCYMAVFEESVYLNVPVNLVHYLDDGRLYADNWGKFHRHSVDELNKLWMEGYEIDWKQIVPAGTTIDCGRKEVEYQFVSRN